ncbi:MAG: flagellar hook-associated protein FlgK [Bryobacterales bacterium]|nr:flagellar hook-associated protein FlgK [Bryobacterales bacterium]
MSNLMTSLMTTASTMRAYERAISTVQNNVNNVSTAGYAKQRQLLDAQMFLPDRGFSGGVRAGSIVSYRDQLAEREVQTQQNRLGYYETHARQLKEIEANFGLEAAEGIQGAMNRLFSASAAWSINVNNLGLRSDVLERARGVAEAFNDLSARLTIRRSVLNDQIDKATAEVNALAERIRNLNAAIRSDNSPNNDAGVEAQLMGALEDLSEIVNFQVINERDGSVTVLLGGQVPLVLGDQVFALPDAQSSDPERVTFIGRDGRDITSLLSGGRLGALMKVRNDDLPQYIRQLDALAANFADGDTSADPNATGDGANTILTRGYYYDYSVDPPELKQGVPLFIFEAGLEGTAGGMKLNPNLRPEMLAALRGNPPSADPSVTAVTVTSTNGVALELAALGTARDPRNPNDLTFIEELAQLVGKVGRDSADSSIVLDVQEQITVQARLFRDELSKVNLDEEAAFLVGYQRAFEANAQLMRVISELTDVTLQMLR